jgi:hypothetical protein
MVYLAYFPAMVSDQQGSSGPAQVSKRGLRQWHIACLKMSAKSVPESENKEVESNEFPSW